MPANVRNDGIDQTTRELLNLFTPRGFFQLPFGRTAADATLKEAVLALLEPLDHGARFNQLYLLGLSTRGDASSTGTPAFVAALDKGTRASIKRFISDLAAGDFYERYLALSSCFGSRDAEHALRVLSDRSNLLRRFALKIAAYICDDRPIAIALATVGRDEQQSLIKRLRKLGRSACVETYLEKIRSTDADRFVAILCYASQDFVEKHRDEVLARMSTLDWTRLARSHPDLAIAWLLPLVKAGESGDPRLRSIANSVLPFVSRSRPDGAFSLLEALLTHFPLNDLRAENLLRFRAPELARLVCTGSPASRLNFSRHLHKLERSAIVELVRRQVLRARDAARWLKDLPPPLRASLFEELGDGFRNETGQLGVALIELLAPEVRASLAREHLRYPQLSTRPAERLPYAQFLPWRECLNELDVFLRDPDAELRAIAIAPLVRCVKFQRSETGEMLTLLQARRHEQDPVRMVALQMLAGLPPGLWQAAHLEKLGAVIRDALDAKDLSQQSLTAVQFLLLKILPFHGSWAGDWLAVSMRERDIGGIPLVANRLNNSHIRALAPLVLPVLQSWRDKERESFLIRFATVLGHRLEAFDGLLDILEGLARNASTATVCEQALGLIRARSPGRFDRLAPELLQADPSWSLRALVRDYLHEKRQDLLTPYLGQHAYSGKFGGGKARIIPSYLNGFHRWTRTQRQIFQRSLIDMLAAPKPSTTEQIFALTRLAKLPDAPLDVIVGFARSDPSGQAAVRDFAVQCLAAMDAGEGVPELIECLNDQRVRVAIYSLRAAVLKLPPREALQLLQNIPRQRITVFKEAVRLIGELRTDDAFAALLEISATQLHRDVHIALLRAAWSYLERPQTWAIYSAASSSGDAAVTVSLSRIPTEKLTSYSGQQLLQLLASLLRNPDPKVRVTVMQRCAAMPVLDAGNVLLGPLLTNVESLVPDECDAAVQALLATYVIRQPDVLAGAVRRILGNRRSLTSLVSGLSAAASRNRVALLPTARSVLLTLQQDPLTLCQQIRLAAIALPFDELAEFIATASARDLLHAGAVESLVQAIHGAANRPDAELLEKLESRFAADSDEVLRRVAIASLVALSESNRGWDPVRLQRLREFRRDPSPLVAEVAQFTLPAIELAQAAG
jgi:hypothetical protein